MDEVVVILIMGEVRLVIPFPRNFGLGKLASWGDIILVMDEVGLNHCFTLASWIR